MKDQKVSNVIDDNLTLRKELKDAFSEINRLESQQIAKNRQIFQLNDQIAKITAGQREMARPKKMVGESIRDQIEIIDQAEQEQS